MGTILFLCCVTAADDMPVVPEDIASHKVNIHDSSGDSDKFVYYLSNPWLITICMVVGIVVCFNISMICYVKCCVLSGRGGGGIASFFNGNKRKGYKNVAVDSEDLSNSEMEQINIECE